MDEPQRLSEMDPDVARLLKSAASRRASPLARQRVLSTLFPLGAPALAATGSTGAVMGVKGWVLVGVLATAGIGGGVRALRAPPSSPPRAPSAKVVQKPEARAEVTTMPRAVLVIPASTADAPMATAAPKKPRAKRLLARAPTIQAPEQKPPTLAQELSFLDGAQQAMRQGDSHRALMTLEEYEKTFPDGRTLDIEAHTLRIEALVKEGRVSEAKEAAARFLDIYPHSVLAARVVATLQAIGKEKP